MLLSNKLTQANFTSELQSKNLHKVPKTVKLVRSGFLQLANVPAHTRLPHAKEPNVLVYQYLQ